jgi:hypothetical protein
MAYDSRRWLALSVLLLAAVMDLVDVSIVNIALPTIREDLDATAVYLLSALAMLLLPKKAIVPHGEASLESAPAES